MKNHIPARTTWTQWRCVAVLAFAAAATGCGGGSEAVIEGVVTLNGRPLDRGSVTFIPVERGPGASANINPDGTYAARTGSTQGLEPGEYVVTVRANADPVPNPQGGPPTPGKLLTPAKYGSSQTSDIRFTVESGKNHLDVKLSS